MNQGFRGGLATLLLVLALSQVAIRSLDRVWWDTTIVGATRFDGWMMTMRRTATPRLLSSPLLPRVQP